MSGITAAPMINVSAEEAQTIRIDPYYIAMMEGASVEHFDLNTTRPMCEHIEWLEGQQAHLERWVAVLRQLDDGVLVAEPWIIETVRENAISLHDDSLYHNDRCGGSCNCADIEQRSAALHALADRLEGALVESPRIKVDSTEVETLMDTVIGNSLVGASQGCDPCYDDNKKALDEGPHAFRPLVVRPEEVVQLVEASDGRLVADGAVGSSVIVEVEPAVEGCVAFAAVAVDRAVGPAAEERADEAFCFAVGLGTVGACA